MANGTWKLSRRGSGQFPLAAVAVLVIVVLLLGKAQPQLFDRTRAHISDFIAPALESVRGPIGAVDRWFGSIGEIFVVYQENLRLKEENARLKQWRNTAVVLNERVERYQLLLHAVPDPQLSTILSRVIGRADRPFLETMILDAGKLNGAKPGQAVVDARGMIGRVYIVGQHTSWVILLTDLNSRVPVTIEPGNIQAIMAGDNTPSPTLEVVSQRAVIKPGAQVTSSGDGGLLPPGLAIGTIAGGDGNFRVQLLADAASSTDVEILDFKRPPETPPTPTISDLPASEAHLPPAPNVRVIPPGLNPTLAPATPNAPAHPTQASTAPQPNGAATATNAGQSHRPGQNSPQQQQQPPGSNPPDEDNQ